MTGKPGRVERECKEQQPLRCACCHLPAAHIQGDVLVITSRHGSEHHTTTISLAGLDKLLREV